MLLCSFLPFIWRDHEIAFAENSKLFLFHGLFSWTCQHVVDMKRV